MDQELLWSYKRNEVLLTIDSFIVRVNIKYEAENFIISLLTGDMNSIN